MQAAVKTAIEGSLSGCCRAWCAKIYTLKDWLPGKVQHDTNPGCRPYLTESKERIRGVFNGSIHK